MTISVNVLNEQNDLLHKNKYKKTADRMFMK